MYRGSDIMADVPRILYCHCAYAQVVPAEVKAAVLQKLCDSGMAFDAVPDLCEMSARQDPNLQNLVANGCLKIAACYPRAVKWLFAAGGAPLPENGAEILNMRAQPVDEVVAALLTPGLQPNVPNGRATTPDAPEPAPTI